MVEKKKNCDVIKNDFIFNLIRKNNNENIKKIITYISNINFSSVYSNGFRKYEEKMRNSKANSNKASLCKGLFPNGTYTGAFEVKADGELSYYTEYLEIKNGEIRIYPVFNSQTRELSFNIKNDNVKVICK